MKPSCWLIGGILLATLPAALAQNIDRWSWMRSLPDDIEGRWAQFERDRALVDSWIERGKLEGKGSLAGIERANITYMAFERANLAYILGHEETEDLIDVAVALHTRLPNTGEDFALGHLAGSHQMLETMLDRGDVSEAAKLIDRLRAPSNGMGMMAGMSSMNEGEFFRAIGDFEAAEKSSMAIKQWLDQMIAPLRAGKSEARENMGTVQSMILVRIASDQAAQNKMGEASRTMEEAAAEFRLGKEGVLAIDSDYYIQGGETWLAIGEVERALEFAGKAAALPPFDRVTDPISANRTRELRTSTLRARALLEAGRFQEAEQAWRETRELLKLPAGKSTLVRPAHHPEVIAAQEGLAWALLLQEKQEAAVSVALTAHESQMELVSRLFSYASERQRLSFLQSADPYSLLAATGQVGKLAEAVVRLKGSVLDSVLEDRRNAAKATSPEAQELWKELQTTRRLAIDASLKQEENSPDWAAKIGSLEARLGALTQVDGKKRGSLELGADQVKTRVGESEALCEFVRYQHRPPQGGREPHYGVLVFRRDFDTAWIPLGEATGIEEAIARLNGGVSGLADLSEETLSRDLKTLFNRLLAPLLPFLESSTRLILSPDGDLSCLSFAVLLDEEGKFAAERWDLGYVSTARDLLEESGKLKSPVEMAIFADPDFSASAAGIQKGASFRSIAVPFSLDLPEIAPLPGTRRELEALQLLGSSQGWKIAAFAGKEATEARANSLPEPPTILHFATHGIFLERQGGVEAGGGGLSSARVDDPLQRSFLALAGAQNTFEQWARLEAPDAGSDGILNAVEISLLDLDETWLATLSACDTARGESLEGEGVLGLRRGFFLAGVDHLLMTFWPIADEETVALMEAFYRELSGSGHPALALSKVQREALVRFREERGLFGAVALAGPFAVSFSGSLPTKE